VRQAVVERPRPSPAVIAWRDPEGPSPQDTRPPRLIADQPALDGLRDVGVASVLLFHAGFSWAVCGLYGEFAATPEQLQALRGDVLATLGYVANWHLLFSGRSYAQLFSSPSPVEPFWSLAIEEQFYFVFPLLAVGVLAMARGSRRALGVTLGLVAIGSVLLTAVLYNPGGDTSRVYYGTDTRARSARRRSCP
jgi:peptidoglycan/LPS O-acetylase OafA/YrhL